MARFKLLILSLPLCFTAVSLLLVPQERAENQRTSNSGMDPGSGVQQAYYAQVKRLRGYYESLVAMLRASAPDLVPLLDSPEPLEHGYGILPRILTSQRALEPVQSRSAGYSWPWTHHLIDEQLSKIARAERELQGVAGRHAEARRAVFEELARSYPEMRQAQNRIDAHIAYNRLWQAAIAENRAAYDRQTFLHDTVIERQAIRQALTGQRAGPRRFSILDKHLQQRVALLDRDIEAAISVIQVPRFVRIEQTQPRVWNIIVPISTDIEDADFVRVLKSEVEKIWRLRDGKDEFRVELALAHVSPEELYAGHPPRSGDKIDIRHHIARFPSNGAILTTGGATTHVYGRALVLGPHAIASRVLAHEIGHLLGFKDSYFRGYRALGGNGFEVLEIVAAPEDIMGAPASGAVLRRHFERILQQSIRPRAQASLTSSPL
jgi:hypothetical protein